MFVFTEIPEALTFTPFLLSLEYGEEVEGAKTEEQARFLCLVDGAGNQIYNIKCAYDHGDEYDETLERDEEALLG